MKLFRTIWVWISFVADFWPLIFLPVTWRIILRAESREHFLAGYWSMK